MGTTSRDPNDFRTVTKDLTLEKLLSRDRMEYYRQMAKNNKNIKIISNEKAIYDYIYENSCVLKQTLAICDDYIFWAMHNESSDSGKIMVMDTNGNENVENGNVHQIFFDDNMAFDKPYIVDVRDLALPLENNGKSDDCHECQCISDTKFTTVLQDTHLIKVEPYQVITDDNYFYNKIQFCRTNLQKLCG